MGRSIAGPTAGRERIGSVYHAGGLTVGLTMRLEDESATIREAYPEAYVDLAAIVTDLGGATGLILVLAVIYWVAPGRRRAAVVAGYAVVGVGAIVLLKYLLAVPRPPASIHAVSLTDDPYGFPSGHAFLAVLVYGGLVVAYDRRSDLAAVLGAGALVLAISLSRVVLGLHYLSDVLVGAVLGLVVLAALVAALGNDPRRGFALGSAVAVPAVVVTGDPYAVVALGAGIGGALAATWLYAVPEPTSRTNGLAVAAVGVCFLLAVSAFDAAFVADGSAGSVAVHAVLVAGILLVPAAVERAPVGARPRPG